MQKSIDRGPSSAPSNESGSRGQSALSSSLRGMDFAAGEAHLAPIQAKGVQFGKRDQKKKERDRKQQLRDNELAIEPYRNELKAMNRRLLELSTQARTTGAEGESFEAAAPSVAERDKFDKRFNEIVAASGVEARDDETTPPIVRNSIEAFAKVKVAFKAHSVARLDALGGRAQEAQQAGKHEEAHAHYSEIAKRAGDFGDGKVEETWDEKKLRQELVAASLPEAQKLGNVYMDALLLPMGAADTLISNDIEARKASAFKGNKDLPKLKGDATKALQAFKNSPGYVKARKSVTAMLAKRGMSKAQDDYEKSPTPVLEDRTLKQAFIGMATVKAGKDSSIETEVKQALISHLALDKKYEAQSVDEILKAGISRKSERIKYLFEDQPELLAQCKKLVKSEEVHKTLQDIKGGAEHSIKDINDYVGDKLNDPLMRWVINNGISVEVHATSLIASFGKMKSEGFTDLIEIPSKHTGTKKWVCVNPTTKEAKVVFQTLPGESYGIQTAGAFLFREIYDVAPQVKDKYGEDKVTKGDVDTKDSFTHPGYKARNVISEDKSSVTFCLVSEKGQQYLSAVVSFVKEKPSIGGKGEIELGKGEKLAVEIHDVDVKSMQLDKLAIFKEDFDYVGSYVDLIKSNGGEGAMIACIGRVGALKEALATKDVAVSRQVDLPHFTMTLFDLKKGGGATKLLGFSISPEFFGEKCGHLAKALEKLGVKHITFAGTAGGLLDDSEVGDVVVPKKLANYSNGKMGEESRDNKAFGMVDDLNHKDVADGGLKKGDTHVGVHSPITESQQMVDTMKKEKVSSVDCEAGFIADALKGSDVSLYMFYYISDVPGTHHSIGQGGLAKGGEDQGVKKGTEPTERALLHVIKTVIGEEIAKANKSTKDALYPIEGGQVKGLKSGKITIDTKLPKSFKVGESYTGTLKAFALQLSEAIGPEGKVDGGAQAKILKLVQTFRLAHGIVFLVTFG